MTDWLTGTSPLGVHSSLHFGLQFLLTLATVLPAEPVEDVLVPFLLDRRSLLDFKKSDLKAKSMILSAGFQFIDVMHKRNMRTDQPVALIHEILMSLVGTCGAIREMMQGPLQPREDIDWHPSLFSSPSEHRAYLKMLETGSEILAELVLVHYQRCICRYLSTTETLKLDEIMRCIEGLLPLVNTTENTPSSVKEAALDVMMMGLRVIERRTIGEELKSFAQFCMEIILPTIDSYICWHLPQRTNQTQHAHPSQREKEIKVDDLNDFTVGCTVLCRYWMWPLS